MRVNAAAVTAVAAASLPVMNAPIGMGDTRFISISPCSRSIATPAPNPNKDGPIAANTPYAARFAAARAGVGVAKARVNSA